MRATSRSKWIAAGLVLAAGLFGALGVGGAAYAMHGGADMRLSTSAAAIALVHAPALLALAALATRVPRVAGLCGSMMIVGTVLFSGDLAARIVWSERLFANAAPMGGGLLILAWLVLGLAGAVAMIRSGRQATGDPAG